MYNDNSMTNNNVYVSNVFELYIISLRIGLWARHRSRRRAEGSLHAPPEGPTD